MPLPGHNTKKKYYPKSPLLKKPQKCQKNVNFGAYFDHFLMFFCHFEALKSTENLGGIALFFDNFLFKIWKNVTFFPQESMELHVKTISQPPSNPAWMQGGSENPNPA